MGIDTKQLASTLAQASGTSIPDASKLANIASQLSTTASSLANSSATKASLIMGMSSASGLGSTIEDTAKSFIRDSAAVLSDSKLGSIMDTVNAGSKEADTKIKNILGTSGEALNTPVSFTTKAIKDVTGGSQLASDANSSADLLTTNLNKTELSTIASRTGSDPINTGGGLSSALKTVAGSVSSIISGATSSIRSAVSAATGVVGNVYNTVAKTASSITSGVTSTLFSALSSFTGSKTSQLDDAISILPSSVSNRLSNTPSSLSSGIQDSIISQIAGSATNITTKLPGVGDVIGRLTAINSYGPTLTSYPRISNSVGEAIPGISQSTYADTSQVNSMYSLAQSLCPDVNLANAYGYGNNKDLFDTLLGLLGGMGLSGLLSQLMNCGTYFDDRSMSVMKNSVYTDAIDTGDSETYNIAMQAIGLGNIADPEQDMMYLNGNMVLTPWDSANKINAYEASATALDIDIKDLMAGETYSDTTPSVNTESVLAMSSSNTTIVDKYLGKDTRMLSSMMYSAFA